MSHDYPSLTLRAMPSTVIKQDLLDKLNLSLTVEAFSDKSTLYHMGYAQAQADFKYILNYHLNRP